MAICDAVATARQVLDSTRSARRGANTAVAPELRKGVRMLMHHTRDTDQKQWNETRVLAMQVGSIAGSAAGVYEFTRGVVL